MIPVTMTLVFRAFVAALEPLRVVRRILPAAMLTNVPASVAADSPAPMTAAGVA